MTCGVVYKFKPRKRVNGTLFYCFEYFAMLRQYADAKFYIVGISDDDLAFVRQLFAEKYDASIDGIVPIKTTDLYKLKLTHTIVLDIHTFVHCKEFFTNTVHCYSNDSHASFRYKNDRRVIYYGSYAYQSYDVFSYLKLNFGIFRPLSGTGSSVYVSSSNPEIVARKQDVWDKMYDQPLIFKQMGTGVGNIFDSVDTLHYVHTTLDKNNRMIPEAFFYGKRVVIEHLTYDKLDSVQLRYDDIVANGLSNYTLTENDAIIQACLK